MNGIFAIEKPSGVSSNNFLQQVKNALMKSSIFQSEIQRAVMERSQQYAKETGKKPSKRKLRKVSQIKMGHGGTLDPLASGVMVIGIGTGTKKLSEYLGNCTKVYETEALFGVGTTSGDSEGDIIAETSVKHLNWEDLKSVESKFVGHLKQTPPIYAALKLNGKPLYEYAREGIPLPKAIEPRQIQIHSLQLHEDCLSRDHEYPMLRVKEGSEEEEVLNKLNANLMEDKLYFSKEYCESQGLESEEAQVEPWIPITQEEKQVLMEEKDKYRAPLLHFTTSVSSGTYIRSLISDIGKAMRSSCYMVKLIRCQQQEWALDRRNVFKLEHFENNDEKVWSAVLQKVLSEGSSVNVEQEIARVSSSAEPTADPVETAAPADPVSLEDRPETKRTRSQEDEEDEDTEQNKNNKL
ncbi:pseudouridine synthase pus4 [Kluyveromyces marxianus]|nr:pseudouridine synthase pus4 [Kluyveromyces marxianus]KAG0679490.1 pseudouridine synthase pus4 [Kluyveromyces marxianus]